MGLVCLATGGWIVLYMISATWSPAQSLPSHEEKGPVTIERLLGCAESAVLILDKPIK